jgi:hypothetical protein
MQKHYFKFLTITNKGRIKQTTKNPLIVLAKNLILGQNVGRETGLIEPD